MSAKAKRDDARCDHGRMDVRVSNIPDTEGWKPGRALRSVWVCDARACVLDAMAWVERGTGERAIAYAGVAGSPEWSDS